MSIENVKLKNVKDNTKSINADDLDRSKLAFISFGSLCGMGIGLFLSFMFSNTWIKIIFGTMLLITGFYSIIKALHTATGKEANKIETLFAKMGDLGKVAEEITKTKIY